MNNYKKLGVLALVVFATAGCGKQFLDRYPLDEISNETFWKSENDLKIYNNGLYHMAMLTPILMGHPEYGGGFNQDIWYLDAYTDNLAPREERLMEYQQLRAGKHNVPTYPQLYGWDSQGWSLVRGINVGLENYGNADVTEEIRNRYAGEARLLRGWFYADKISRFGDFPWVDKVLNIDSEELYGARTPREEAMQHVLEDLNFATENLPENWEDGAAPGRLNRWAALLVKSRVCLFEGTWRKYHGGSNANEWLQHAADAAKELIDNGPYHLYSTGNPDHDYNAIHRMRDLTGNAEVLYWRRYEKGILTHSIQSYHKNYNGGATKSLVEDYLCTDGLPISLSPRYKGDATYENLFENRDPRLRQTILHPQDQPYYNYGNHSINTYPYPRLAGMVGGETIETGYHVIKTFYAPEAYAAANSSTDPAIILRFGEALLNYAEAKAELNTLTQEDLDISINKLRDRVAMPHLELGHVPVDPRYISDGVSPLIVEIRRERRVELFMEGFFRYDDLRRWKQGKKLQTASYGIRWDEANKARIDPQGRVTLQTTAVNGIPYIDVYKGTAWENPVFDESKHYLWPVPLSVISQNEQIKQNPGW